MMAFADMYMTANTADPLSSSFILSDYSEQMQVYMKIKDLKKKKTSI